MSLGGDSEEKGDYTGGDSPPWRVSGLSHILGIPVLGSNTGKTSPLASWRATETNRKAVGSLDSTCQDHTSAGLLMRQGERVD